MGQNAQTVVPNVVMMNHPFDFSWLDVRFRRSNRRGRCTQALMVWLEIRTVMVPVGDDDCVVMPTPESVCSGSLGRLKTSKTDVSLRTALRT